VEGVDARRRTGALSEIAGRKFSVASSPDFPSISAKLQPRTTAVDGTLYTCLGQEEKFEFRPLLRAAFRMRHLKMPFATPFRSSRSARIQGRARKIVRFMVVHRRLIRIESPHPIAGASYAFLRQGRFGIFFVVSNKSGNSGSISRLRFLSLPRAALP